MLLTYQFELRVNDCLGIILGHLTYAASKLFNVGNYERKEYKSLGFDKMPNWYDQKKRLKDNVWYRALPPNTAQEVLACLHNSWKSYFSLHSKWANKNKDIPEDERINEPQPPRYKKDGCHSSVKYLPSAFRVMDGRIRFAIPPSLKLLLKEKYNIVNEFIYIKFKKTLDLIKQIEFSYIDKNKYSVSIYYEKQAVSYKEDNKRYISIDIGVKNLLSVYDNNGSSFIVSGSSILNNNYYFSKKIAYYRSILDRCYQERAKGKMTERLTKLYELRRKRTKQILHRSTRMIVDYCSSHDISKVLIGDLSGILSKKNIDFFNNKEKHRYNQNMRAINFDTIYEYLDYKLKLVGVELIKVDESYSSSCAPTSPAVSKEYSEKEHRIERGLFKDGNTIYNADVVGAYNIMRIYKQNNNQTLLMPLDGLSNPKKEYIPVTDQFLNEDYINWNGKAGNVGISGRNYPDGYILEDIIHQYITQILGYSIA